MSLHFLLQTPRPTSSHITWPYMVLTYFQYSPFCRSVLFLLENIASSAEQGFSTNVQVCNDITSDYPEGSHDVFHATVSIQGCPYTRGDNRDGTHTSCSVAEVTSSAPSPDALVTTNEPPPNCTGALTLTTYPSLIISLKNEYSLGRTWTLLALVSTEEPPHQTVRRAHTYNLSPFF